LSLFCHLWSDLPDKGPGEFIDWHQRFSLYPKIFASDAVFTFPFASSVVSPLIPVSPLPSTFNGMHEAMSFYSNLLEGLSVRSTSDLCVQPFPEARDYAWAQFKVDFEFALPNGKKYLYQQQYTGQCRVNEQGLIEEYEEKSNPVASIHLFHALGAAKAEAEAQATTANTQK